MGEQKVVDRQYILSGFIVCDHRDGIFFIVMDGVTDLENEHGIASVMLTDIRIVDIDLSYRTDAFELNECSFVFVCRLDLECFSIDGLAREKVSVGLHIVLVIGMWQLHIFPNFQAGPLSPGFKIFFAIFKIREKSRVVGLIILPSVVKQGAGTGLCHYGLVYA